MARCICQATMRCWCRHLKRPPVRVAHGRCFHTSTFVCPPRDPSTHNRIPRLDSVGLSYKELAASAIVRILLWLGVSCMSYLSPNPRVSRVGVVTFLAWAIGECWNKVAVTSLVSAAVSIPFTPAPSINALLLRNKSKTIIGLWIKSTNQGYRLWQPIVLNRTQWAFKA